MKKVFLLFPLFLFSMIVFSADVTKGDLTLDGDVELIFNKSQCIEQALKVQSWDDIKQLLVLQYKLTWHIIARTSFYLDEVDSVIFRSAEYFFGACKKWFKTKKRKFSDNFGLDYELLIMPKEVLGVHGNKEIIFNQLVDGIKQMWLLAILDFFNDVNGLKACNIAPCICGIEVLLLSLGCICVSDSHLILPEELSGRWGEIDVRKVDKSAIEKEHPVLELISEKIDGLKGKSVIEVAGFLLARNFSIFGSIFKTGLYSKPLRLTEESDFQDPLQNSLENILESEKAFEFLEPFKKQIKDGKGFCQALVDLYQLPLSVSYEE